METPLFSKKMLKLNLIKVTMKSNSHHILGAYNT